MALPYINKLFHTRALLLMCFVSVGFFTLFLRLVNLQILDSLEYKRLSNDNTHKVSFIIPKRGDILDRNGVSMTGEKNYSRLIFYKTNNESLETPIESLKYITKPPIDKNAWLQGILKKVNRNQNEKVILEKNLDRNEILGLEFNMHNLLGAQVEKYTLRNYKYGNSVFHITGFVRSPSDSDIKKTKNFEEKQMLRDVDIKIGAENLEKKFNDYLFGKIGVKIFKVDAFGRVLDESIFREAIDGNDIKTTIDIRLQNYLDELLREQEGTIMVMDIENGDILGMHSTPNVDPNMFVRGFDEDEWNDAVGEYKSNIFYNKNLSLLYSPGSTFKIVTALTALEKGVVNPVKHINCNGGYKIGNRFFHCHVKEGHGSVDMHRAIEQSCNTYFYYLSTLIDIDDLYETSKKLGLVDQFDIDCGTSRKTLIPNRDWKRKRFHDAWYPGETANAVIGQGYTEVTPLNLLVMAGRIASGKKVVPNLMKNSTKRNFADMDIKKENLDIIRNGMYSVINDTRGAAYYNRITEPTMLLCGKTGTAQVVSKNVDKDKMKAIDKDLRSHGLFIGFAPCHKPRYAVAVVAEHGQWGSVSAVPLASNALKFMMDLDIQDEKERSNYLDS